MAVRSCVFCGATGELTGEHVFGAWLERLGLPNEPSAHRAGPLNRSPRQMGVVRPFKSKVRDVCASCNNGWMSTLEAAAARALPPLILGNGGAIEAADRPLIAAWAQKTALVSMLVSSEGQRAEGYGLPSSEYRALFDGRATGRPLPDTTAWIGRYSGERVRASTCVAPFLVRIEDALPSNRPQGYMATIILGELIVQLVRFTVPELAVEVVASEELSEVWPHAAEEVRFPEKEIDDRRIIKLEKGAAIRCRLPGVLLEPWRPATDLPESTLQGSMVQMSTPCGKHFIFYPASLAAAGLRGTLHAFITACECGKGYLVVTERDGAHFKLEGSTEAVIDAYERAPGDELAIEDENGTFWCKRLSIPWEDQRLA